MAVFFHSHAFQGAAPIHFDVTAQRPAIGAQAHGPRAIWEIAADGRPVRRWRATTPPD